MLMNSYPFEKNQIFGRKYVFLVVKERGAPVKVRGD